MSYINTHKRAVVGVSARDVAGFVAGVLSIGAWLVAQMPQIVSNFRNRSADALSAWFLVEWLLVSAWHLHGAGTLLLCAVLSSDQDVYKTPAAAGVLSELDYLPAPPRRRSELSVRGCRAIRAT